MRLSEIILFAFLNSQLCHFFNWLTSGSLLSQLRIVQRSCKWLELA